jgi:hypothetical protein
MLASIKEDNKTNFLTVAPLKQKPTEIYFLSSEQKTWKIVTWTRK